MGEEKELSFCESVIRAVCLVGSCFVGFLVYYHWRCGWIFLVAWIPGAILSLFLEAWWRQRRRRHDGSRTS